MDVKFPVFFSVQFIFSHNLVCRYVSGLPARLGLYVNWFLANLSNSRRPFPTFLPQNLKFCDPLILEAWKNVISWHIINSAKTRLNSKGLPRILWSGKVYQARCAWSKQDLLCSEIRKTDSRSTYIHLMPHVTEEALAFASKAVKNNYR